jgi:hypothetical protein
MEAADATVSLDLLVKLLSVLGHHEARSAA